MNSIFFLLSVIVEISRIINVMLYFYNSVHIS